MYSVPHDICVARCLGSAPVPCELVLALAAPTGASVFAVVHVEAGQDDHRDDGETLKHPDHFETPLWYHEILDSEEDFKSRKFQNQKNYSYWDIHE